MNQNDFYDAVTKLDKKLARLTKQIEEMGDSIAQLQRIAAGVEPLTVPAMPGITADPDVPFVVPYREALELLKAEASRRNGGKPFKNQWTTIPSSSDGGTFERAVIYAMSKGCDVSAVLRERAQVLDSWENGTASIKPDTSPAQIHKVQQAMEGLKQLPTMKGK